MYAIKVSRYFEQAFANINDFTQIHFANTVKTIIVLY